MISENRYAMLNTPWVFYLRIIAGPMEGVPPKKLSYRSGSLDMRLPFPYIQYNLKPFLILVIHELFAGKGVPSSIH